MKQSYIISKDIKKTKENLTKIIKREAQLENVWVGVLATKYHNLINHNHHPQSKLQFFFFSSWKCPVDFSQT